MKMNVNFKTVDRFMNEICEKYNIDGDVLEFYTDIEKINEYIVRAYDPINNQSLTVKITKPKTRYVYTVEFSKGDIFERLWHLSH